jgi:hypothetical protein
MQIRQDRNAMPSCRQSDGAIICRNALITLSTRGLPSSIWRINAAAGCCLLLWTDGTISPLAIYDIAPRPEDIARGGCAGLSYRPHRANAQGSRNPIVGVSGNAGPAVWSQLVVLMELKRAAALPHQYALARNRFGHAAFEYGGPNE